MPGFLTWQEENINFTSEIYGKKTHSLSWKPCHSLVECLKLYENRFSIKKIDETGKTIQ